jgi:hypothetical protein
VRNMTQSRGGRVRSRLVAIKQPSQICRACAHRHAANVLTHGARLRSWMEGWRITCPVCGAALEDFRLYTRLFRADPSDALLVRIERSAREGEQIMDRASRRRGSASAHAALMRDLLLPQVPRTATRGATTTPRLLDLVVPDSEGFFQRLQPENWPCTARMLPLSIRVPVLAGGGRVEPSRLLDRQAGQRGCALSSGWTDALHPVGCQCPHAGRTSRGSWTVSYFAAILRLPRPD